MSFHVYKYNGNLDAVHLHGEDAINLIYLLQEVYKMETMEIGFHDKYINCKGLIELLIKEIS